MKTVILDGYTENPGDLSWEGFEALGEVTVYDRTAMSNTLFGRMTRRFHNCIPAVRVDLKQPFGAGTGGKVW